MAIIACIRVRKIRKRASEEISARLNPLQRPKNTSALFSSSRGTEMAARVPARR